jgi:hypothetical protein
MLRDASTETKSFSLYNLVSGSIQIRIKHFPPKPQRKVHGFSITIVKCKDLAQNTNAKDDINPFVVLHMLPDPEAVTTQHTHTQTKSSNPTFAEMFFFTTNTNAESYQRELHVSVWSQDQSVQNTAPVFLGYCTVPLGPTMNKKRINRWYSLCLLETDGGTLYVIIESHMQQKKSHKKFTSEEERHNKPREFVKSYQLHGGPIPRTHKEHNLVEKVHALLACGVCNSMMMGSHYSCTHCSMVCHHKCKDFLTPACGGMGAIRLKLELVVSDKFI